MANLGQYLSYSDSENLTIERYLQTKNMPSIEPFEWQRSEVEVPNMGQSDKSYWFRLRLKYDNNLSNSLSSKVSKNVDQNSQIAIYGDRNSDRNHKSLFLALNNPFIDYINFYVLRDGELVDEYQTGDKFPFDQRRVAHRHYIFPLDLDRNHQYEVLIKVKSNGVLQVPLTLWQPEAFWTDEQFNIISLGIYYGVMLVMIFYNLFLFFSVRDSNYLIYILFVGSGTLFWSCMHGLSLQYFWPSRVDINDLFLLLTVGSMSFFATLFTSRFLQMDKHFKRTSYVLYILIIFYALFAVTAWLWPYQIALKLTLVMGSLATIICFFSGVLAWVKGVRHAKFFTMAWFCFLLGTLLQNLSKGALLPRVFITEYSAQIGAIVEVVLFSLALGDRINQERKSRYKAQRALLDRMTQLDKMKDEFLANTSHELRTPLFGMIGLAESIRDGATGVLPDATKQNLQMIVNSGRRLSNLVNDILDFSKLKNHNFQLHNKSVDLYSTVEVVLGLCTPLIGEKSLGLVNAVDKDICRVEADEDRLQQILYNLIGNAIKFTNSGDVTITAERIDQKLKIRVVDTGIGIAEEKLDKVFGVFEQLDGADDRSYGGVGLGLSISKQLVHMLGGELSVVSELGKGSEFWFTLPVMIPSQITGEAQVQQDAILTPTCRNTFVHTEIPIPTLTEVPINTEDGYVTEPLDKAKALKNSKFKILVVDDEPVNRQILLNHLSLDNYSVTTVSSADQALALFRFEGGLSQTNAQLEGRKSEDNVAGEEASRERTQRESHIANRKDLAVDNTFNNTWKQALPFEDESYYKAPPFDLVLLDVMMPRTSGYDACKVLRKLYTEQALPIVLITAKNIITDLLIGYQAGANDYLTKPIIKEELLARVRLHLKLLESNRDLEQKVSERTKYLQQEHQKLKMTQCQLVQSERMASMSNLLAGMTHEINNPINMAHVGIHNITRELAEFKKFVFGLLSVDADAEITREFESRFEKISRRLESTTEGTSRVKQLLESFRSFCHPNEQQHEQVAMSDLLGLSLEVIKARYANQVKISITFEKDPKFFCYVAQLSQVFMNVMINACQSIVSPDEQKSVTQGVGDTPPLGHLDIKCKLNKNQAEMIFSDDGCGMSEQTRTQIFEPFFTTKEVGGGVGLGMAISFGIVERHKGRIEVDSTLGEGTTVRITLPLDPRANTR